MLASSSLLDCEAWVDQRERKFLPSAEAARAFWAIASVHMHPDPGPGAVAYARTTYYDTPDLSYYRSSGLRLRVREYAEASHVDERPRLADRCYLELKQSAGGLRSKTRVAAPADEVERLLALHADAPLTACVSTWYRRRALRDDDRRLRITLDEHLLLCKPRPLGSSFAALEADDVLARGPAYVLEYKSWDPPPPWLVNALVDFDEAVGFSKFMLGMRAALDVDRNAPQRCSPRLRSWRAAKAR